VSNRRIKLPRVTFAPKQKIYQPKALAKAWGIRISTLWRWRQRGLLPETVASWGKRYGWTEPMVRKVERARNGGKVTKLIRKRKVAKSEIEE
jgi:hypothetical protein